ncbi:hypothetical protein CGZ91_13020 [Parenemella sanctibonifatiensis]|uniref:Uncharacterized protein n=2 Tax=Parenemella sanctibonifatiensis TaxID=2016505 RepID=A0A255EC80_9ACTN|nr:hypothetical protein CGZ91_13020 [Parenemella sanctibonifatiensis]
MLGVDVPSQRVMNMCWPQGSDRTGWHARGIPDQPRSIPVEVRVVWETDGEEWCRGHARRWTATHVYVDLSDPRLIGPGVLAGDVRRIEPGELGHGVSAA